jgi:hypothetical protein
VLAEWCAAPLEGEPRISPDATTAASARGFAVRDVTAGPGSSTGAARFLCRRCQGFAYESTRLDKATRQLYRPQDIRTSKPKGMQRRRYYRLRREAERLEHESLMVALERFDPEPALGSGGRNRESTVVRSVPAEEVEQRADLQAELGRVAHLLLAVDRVVVASADAADADVAGVGEVGDDFLGGPLGDPDLLGDVAESDLRVAVNAEQDLRVVADEAPVLLRLFRT